MAVVSASPLKTPGCYRATVGGGVQQGGREPGLAIAVVSMKMFVDVDVTSRPYFTRRFPTASASTMRNYPSQLA